MLGVKFVVYKVNTNVQNFRTMFLVISLQIRLRQRIQQDIITDLRTPDKLKESLDVVDIVLGLLSSGGASDDVRLEKYILSTKMGKKPFSAKVSNRDMYLYFA